MPRHDVPCMDTFKLGPGDSGAFHATTRNLLAGNDYTEVLPALERAEPISAATFRHEGGTLDVSETAVGQHRIFAAHKHLDALSRLYYGTHQGLAQCTALATVAVHSAHS